MPYQQRSALFAEGIRSEFVFATTTGERPHSDVRVHDIRRTVADALLNRIGVSPWIVDHVVLGHARPKLLRTYMPTLPLSEGAMEADLLDAYPHLTAEDIRAPLAYAADAVSHEDIVLTASSDTARS